MTNPFAITTANDTADLQAEVESATPVYLGNLQIQHGVSKAVKRREAQIGDFILNGKNLGTKVRLVVGERRSHADYWKEGKKVAETFDNKSKEWAEISGKAKNYVSGAKAGPEFFCHVVDTGECAILRFARSSLSKATEFHAVSGKLITMGVEYIGKNETPVPTVEKVHEGETYPAIDDDYLTDMITKFRAPTLEKKGQAGGLPR